jgi:hypothetical protein
MSKVLMLKKMKLTVKQIMTEFKAGKTDVENILKA